MFDENTSRQAAERIRKVMTSRLTIIAASVLVVSLLVIAIPELEPERNRLLLIVMSLGLALIGGTRRNGKSKEPCDASEPFAVDPRDMLRDLIENALDDEQPPEQQGR